MTAERAMRRAIELSRRGLPAPNPHVGCVIVRDGEIVSEGWHDYAGGPHAERVALAKARGQAIGGTAYVTLEPCNHHGRTPPCVDGLIEAGIAKVVIAVQDPNPRAKGGLERLRRAGIEVEVGLLAERAMAANRRWLGAYRLGRPWVTVKAGCSLDGRIALESGESQWITGEMARRQAHRLRAEHAAILVGRRTVELDDPRLTARIRGVRNQPTRVVLDPSGKLHTEHRVFDHEAPTLRFGTGGVVESCEPVHVLQELWNRGLTSVLIEGGGTTIGHFLEAGLVDELQLMVAPAVLGNGPAWASLAVGNLADAPRFEIQGVRRLGGDLWIQALR